MLLAYGAIVTVDVLSHVQNNQLEIPTSHRRGFIANESKLYPCALKKWARRLLVFAVLFNPCQNHY